MSQPLTGAEKATIRLYGGYQARFHSTDSALEQALKAIDGGDVDTYNLVETLLASLADVDAKLLDADSRLKVSEVGSIKLNAVEVGMLRSKGRQFVGRLFSLLGCPVRHDVFSGAFSRGPYWGQAGIYGGQGGGNLPPLG